MFKNLFKTKQLSMEEIDNRINELVLMMNGDIVHDKYLHREYKSLIKRSCSNVY